MAGNLKLNVKLNGSEFSADGPEKAVGAQYERWFELVAKRGHSGSNFAVGGTAEGGEPADAGLATTAKDWWAGSAIEPGLLKRVFNVDLLQKALSLRTLPSTQTRDADALLLLLYGYAKFLGQPHVTGSRLLKQARISGITNLPRVTPLLESHGDKVTTAGAYRGKTYGLNRPGEASAEEIINGILK